jgi:hypothetical protein
MYDVTPTIDRVLRARPRDFDPSLIEKATGWLLGYRRHLGNAPTCHAPETIRILAVEHRGQAYR